MNVWNKLPAVISCCFCCFLRAGSVMIAVVSFITGLLLAPNVSHGHGFWEISGVFTNTQTAPEAVAQMILGMVSIVLCVVSLFLLVGALCNFPTLIEIYQWGIIGYSACIVLLFSFLSIYCIAVHGNCLLASGTLFAIIVINVLLTLYFVMVVNSLRLALVYQMQPLDV